MARGVVLVTDDVLSSILLRPDLAERIEGLQSLNLRECVSGQAVDDPCGPAVGGVVARIVVRLDESVSGADDLARGVEDVVGVAVADGGIEAARIPLPASLARPRGGGRGSNPRWVRILPIAARCRIAAMIFSSPAPQLGQRRRSMPNTRSSNRAQPMGCARVRSGSACSYSADAATPVATCARAGGPCGTTRARNLALGASTPWYRIRCSRGRGTSAASRCMNSSGLSTRCVVPSRHGVFNSSCTCPAAFTWMRSFDSAGRVI
jgi:hypothetical protein